MSAAESNNNNIVLISGGAAGIGRHIAEAFLDDGARVHICDSSSTNIRSFLDANPGATATQADVSDARSVDQVFTDLENLHDGLDILINNAGIAGPTATVEDIEVEEWDGCVAVNLSGTFYVTRRAIPLLKKRGAGAIINISSVAGTFPCPLRSPYVASKWALIGLTKTWAMELGPHNIRVNAVCPTSVSGERIDGVIERDAAKRGVSADQIRDVYQRQSSMRTFVTPQDVSNMVVFLGSDRAGKISGQAIGVDGNTEGLANWLD
jgi:NAD(P)-dependent dehydrogenase (short-subunit alcohol dehydrogenase family)